MARERLCPKCKKTVVSGGMTCGKCGLIIPKGAFDRIIVSNNRYESPEDRYARLEEQDPDAWGYWSLIVRLYEENR